MLINKFYPDKSVSILLQYIVNTIYFWQPWISSLFFSPCCPKSISNRYFDYCLEKSLAVTSKIHNAHTEKITRYCWSMAEGMAIKHIARHRYCNKYIGKSQNNQYNNNVIVRIPAYLKKNRCLSQEDTVSMSKALCPCPRHNDWHNHDELVCLSSECPFFVRKTC
jgi:hypothetical protein